MNKQEEWSTLLAAEQTIPKQSIFSVSSDPLLFASGASRRDKTILWAFHHNDTRKMRRYLRDGECFGLTDGCGNSLLHYASYWTDSVALAMLVKSGVDVNAKNYDGQTALHISAYYGADEVLTELLSFGANPNVRDSWGMTPLFYAIWGHSGQSIELLIEKGGSVDARKWDGMSLKEWAEFHHISRTGIAFSENGRKQQVIEVLK